MENQCPAGIGGKVVSTHCRCYISVSAQQMGGFISYFVGEWGGSFCCVHLSDSPLAIAPAGVWLKLSPA